MGSSKKQSEEIITSLILRTMFLFLKLYLFLCFTFGFCSSCLIQGIYGVTPDMASNDQPVLLYNPSYAEYLFVSEDLKDTDHVVKSRPGRIQNGNQFLLHKLDNGLFKIYNIEYKEWLFVSNDRDGRDHIIESHPSSDEARNSFKLEPVGNNREYLIYNPSYKEYLFVSNTKLNGDNIVLSHPEKDEKRNRFHLQLTPDMVPNDQPVRLYNPSYDEYLYVSEDLKDTDHVVKSHPGQNKKGNRFLLHALDNGLFKLYNIEYKEWLFVSNDRDGRDHIVESHPSSNEARNSFKLEPVGSNRREYLLYNPSYKVYLFVSNTKLNGDNIVLSHPEKDERRNRFHLQLTPDIVPNDQPVRLYNPSYAEYLYV